MIFGLFKSGLPAGNDNAYSMGQYVGAGFGILMFVAGLYYLAKGDGGGPKKKTKKESIARITGWDCEQNATERRISW